MNDPDFVARLQAVVAKEAGLSDTQALLARKRRELYICHFRDTAIYLARVHTKLGWERLAAMFGARHHSSLINAYRREELRLKRNPPRRDKRKQSEWHDFLLMQVQAKNA